MDQGLAQLSAIPNVGGAFVCDNHGEVIASSSPAVLATGTMSTMGREVGRIFAVLESSGKHATRLEFTYTNWRLLAIDLEEALLFVVCLPVVDVSFLRMSIDIVLTQWRADVDVQRQLRRHRATRQQVAITKWAADRRTEWRRAEPSGI